MELSRFLVSYFDCLTFDPTTPVQQDIRFDPCFSPLDTELILYQKGTSKETTAPPMEQTAAALDRGTPKTISCATSLAC